MNNTDTPSAKEKVLARVRSKNPSTMELKPGCKFESKNGYTYLILCDIWRGAYKTLRLDGGDVYLLKREFFEEGTILGSDMGLQELKIAYPCTSTTRDETTEILHFRCDGIPVDVEFDLTKNLHNQKPEFFEAMLPLVRSHSTQ